MSELLSTYVGSGNLGTCVYTFVVRVCVHTRVCPVPLEGEPYQQVVQRKADGTLVSRNLYEGDCRSRPLR